ncbi:MAG: hypothetical protein JF615_02105 [Asticcacaulis sp.]|nr:hypothetical protein [Asticcacaulis sp.]
MNDILSGDIKASTSESSRSAVHWPAILAGAAAAAGVTLALMPLGSALGFASFSVWTLDSGDVVKFTAGAAIWLVIMQWLSSGIGGYLAGRLRVKWADVHTDEVFFRDTAHGFLSWCVATLVVVALTASLAMTSIHTGVQAAATVGAGAAAGKASTTDAPDLDYYADTLYRTDSPAPATTTADATVETGRILAKGLRDDTFASGDRDYLTRQVIARTGLPEAAARQRVDTAVSQLEAAKKKAADAAEKARKASVTLFTALAISLFVGAFIAAVSGALGGRLRDN